MTTLTQSEAYTILELPVGADSDAVRTSYKRLAKKWFPNMNPENSVGAVSKFELISLAYKRLTTTSDRISMKKDEMIELYWNISNPQQFQFKQKGFDMSDDSDVYNSSDDSDSDVFGLTRQNGMSLQYRRDYFIDGDDDKDNFCNNELSEEQREKVATELITEEERKKKQLEKRRAKKKLRREKKRLEKESAEQQKENSETVNRKGKLRQEARHNGNVADNTQDSPSSVASEESEDCDLSAAFYSKLSSACTKQKLPASVVEKHHAPSIDSNSRHNSNNKDKMQLKKQSAVETNKSRQFAIEGNELAAEGLYGEAIQFFSKAIQLNDTEYRFFGNRSFCYERIGEYEKALSDAQRTIVLSPAWPKGYFRQGIAYARLKLYSEAENSFAHVLKLDSNCIDAKTELYTVRVCQLMEMGFNKVQSEYAALKYDNMQQALEFLLTGVDQSGSAMKKTPTKAGGSKNAPLPPIPAQHYEEAQKQILLNKGSALNDIKMNVNNPEGLSSLWVGNVVPDVTQEQIVDLFSKCGKVHSVKSLPEKFCAFVNFHDKECASLAMKELQGVECNGQRLLIKFPDKPIKPGNVHIDSSSAKSQPTSAHAKELSQPQPLLTAQPLRVAQQLNASQSSNAPRTSKVAGASDAKLVGPVNGNECYFWRTTGCHFSSRCQYDHIPEHKGIEYKPWQKTQ